MRLRIAFTLLCLVVAAAVCRAQSVVLPAEVRGLPGRMIIVAPTKHPADPKTVKWRASPELQEIPFGLIFPNSGPQLARVYEASKPGRYSVEAWVEGDSKLPLDRAAVIAIVDDPKLSDAAKVKAAGSLLKGISACAVVVGDPPEPDPGPGPAPKPDDGRLGLVKASRDGAAKVTSATKSAQAKALAEANRALASKIAAGGTADPATAAGATAVLAEWRKGNNEAADAASWSPWGGACGAALQQLYKDGRLAAKSDWVDAFNEIARGLE